MISYDDIKSGAVAVPMEKPTDTKAVVTQTITGKLPGMIRAAADKLAAATYAAEVLDARDEARLTYSTAQVAGRIAKAKGAHDKVVAAAHRAQADALEIEAEAKRRLADEYDGAQQRGEVQKAGGDRKSKINVPQQNNDPAKVDEIGLTRKDVHDARRVRNAEQVQPGVVRAALEQAIAEGREPSRAVVNEAIAEALGEEKPKAQPRNIFRELVALWKEASPGEQQDFRAFIKRSEFVAKFGLRQESNATDTTGGGDVDRSATRASSAVEVGATNSPDGATISAPGLGHAPGFSSLAAREADESAATYSQSAIPTAEAVAGTPQAPREPATAKSFQPLSRAEQVKLIRPHCQHPGTDLCAGSGRNHCHACKKLIESEAA